MSGAEPKKEREHQGQNPSPERGHQPGKQEDPAWKRDKPDQYDENQGGGRPPVEQAGGKQAGQTGHENPKGGSGQHSGQNEPQGGQRGNPSGQQSQKGGSEQHSDRRPGNGGASEQGRDRGDGHQDPAQKRDVQDRERNKNASETDERGVKQGQKH